MNPLIRVPLRLLFPCSCLICKTDVPGNVAWELSRSGLCEVCEKAIRVDLFRDYSVDSSLRFVSSAASFRGPLRQLVHALNIMAKICFILFWENSWTLFLKLIWVE